MARRPNISKLERRRDVAGLCAAATFRDVFYDAAGQPIDLGSEVREEAVVALAWIAAQGTGEPAATRVLVAAVSDDAPAVRAAALRALAHSAEPAAVDAVAAAAMTGQGDPTRSLALQILETMVAEGRGNAARRTVARYLHAEAEAGEAGDGVAHRVLERLEPTERRAIIDACVEKLGSDSGHVRARASRLLVAFPHESRGLLVAALSDPRLRVAAKETLGHLRDREQAGVVAATGEAPRREQTAPAAAPTAAPAQPSTVPAHPPSPPRSVPPAGRSRRRRTGVWPVAVALAIVVTTIALAASGEDSGEEQSSASGRSTPVAPSEEETAARLAEIRETAERSRAMAQRRAAKKRRRTARRRSRARHRAAKRSEAAAVATPSPEPADPDATPTPFPRPEGVSPEPEAPAPAPPPPPAPAPPQPTPTPNATQPPPVP